MIDLQPHQKAIENIDKLMKVWIASEGNDTGVHKEIEDFTSTEEWYAVPYQHRNLYFVTASKLRTYQKLPSQAYMQYIQCIDLPWTDHDYFRIGRAFDYRITEGEEKFAAKYVCVSTRTDVEQKMADTMRRLEEHRTDFKKDGTRSKTGLDGEVSCLEKLAALQSLVGKSQLTEGQWKDVHNMTEEYRKHTCFPQKPEKKNLIWLAYGKIPCKGELDHWDQENNRIWDIKTTAAITNFDARQYLLQMGFYFMGIQELYMQRPEAALAVVDKGGDFSRGCPFGFKVEDLLGVQGTINNLIMKWKDSMETNTWPDAGENELSALQVYWDSDYYPILEHSRPTKIIYV
jgi:hypothetical protein